MTRLKNIGALFSAVCMICMLGAAAAQARDPQWKVNGALLGSGVGETITAEQNGVQKLSSTGLSLEGTKLKVKAGALIIGSTAPKPGTSKETIEYSGVTVVGFAKCKVNGGTGEIATKPLIDFLAYETEAAALAQNGSGTVTVFEPETGNVFAEFTLSETNPGTGECPATGTLKVERAAGQAGVVTKNLGTATEENVLHEIEAPATAIKTYWLNETKDEEKKAGLKLNGLAATYVGKAKIKSASKYSVS